jgi:hypothetical protein
MKFVSCANHISFDQTKKQFPSQRIRVKGGDHIRKKKKFLKKIKTTTTVLNQLNDIRVAVKISQIR